MSENNENLTRNTPETITSEVSSEHTRLLARLQELSDKWEYQYRNMDDDAEAFATLECARALQKVIREAKKTD